MAASVVKVIPKDGITYAVNDSGATDIVTHYLVVLSEPLGIGEIITSFNDGTNSVPAIGTVHPNRPGYYVAKYDIKQPEGERKATLEITVRYSPQAWATEGGGGEPPEPTEDYQVEEWGWDDGTTDRELVDDYNGNPVLNSAGDPFDSVPSVESPAPTFTKVMKFASRRQYAQYNCTINDSQIVIGNMTCAPHTLLATISEKRNIGDENWPYTYTVRLRYRTNFVKKGGDTQRGEIGWNVAIVDAGMREIDTVSGKLVLITNPGDENREPATVTSPELLDGQGHRVARSASGSAADPYVLVFQAYKAVSFPNWFYSEPPALTNP